MTGQAFDRFLDRLREAGYPVETVPPKGTPKQLLLPCPLGQGHYMLWALGENGGLTLGGECRKRHAEAAVAALRLSDATWTLSMLELADRLHQSAVSEALTRLHVQAEARRQFQAETQAATTRPDFVRLDALLAEPDDPVLYRVDRLWPRGGRVMLSAQYKAGKTTMRDNLVRVLVDGGHFLGEYAVEPITDGTVVIFDDEMSREMIKLWLRDQQIKNQDRIVVVPMRGRAGTLDLSTEDTRAWWRDQLMSWDARVVILDCLAPVLNAFGLDENLNSQIGPVLDGFSSLLTEAGADEGAITHHAGHVAERSRGASRLRDWPDAEWFLVREDPDDPLSPRYFRAVGRDVAEPEGLLTFDPTSRGLLLTGGSRRKSKKAATGKTDVEAVIEVVTRRPGLNKTDLEKVLYDEYKVSRNRARSAISTAESSGRARAELGVDNHTLHYFPGGWAPGA